MAVELKSVKKTKVQEEMTGLEWEAEKAYIMATSPRSVSSSRDNTPAIEDDFSWDEPLQQDTPTSKQITILPNLSDNEDNTNKEDNISLITTETKSVNSIVPQELPSTQNDHTTNEPPVKNKIVNIEHVTDEKMISNLSTDNPVPVTTTDRHETNEHENNKPVSSTLLPSTPLPSTPLPSTPLTSTPVTSTPLASTPLPSTPLTSTPVTSTPLASTPLTSTPVVTNTPLQVISPAATKPDVTPSPSSSTKTQSSLSINTTRTNTLVIYGPSGLGRSTLIKKLVYHSPQQFSLVISHTTRAPKPNEMYARDYYFVSRSDMMQKIRQDKFMEYVQIDNNTSSSYSNSLAPRKSFSTFPPSSIKATSSEGDLYGTTWEAFQEAQYSGKPWVVLNISTKGAEQLKDIGVEGVYLFMSSTNSNESDRLTPDHVITYEKSEEAYGFLENYALSLTQGQIYKPTSKLEIAQDEWERVPSIQLTTGKRVKTKKESTAQKLSQKKITFIELLSHFQNSDLSQQRSLIKPESSHSHLSKVFKTQRITKKLRDERDLVFAIALCKFDDHNPLHARALSTIYQYLSGSTATCSRFGSHWEDIGFQGSDPTDDFRGVGMLGVLQLVWFLDTPQMSPIALNIFNYSKRGPTPLPFCVVSLNITCIILQALREGYISKECNRLEQVFIVCNNLYAAIFVSFYNNWKRHSKGVMELGNLLQKVGAFAKKNARFMIREFENYLIEKETKNSGGKSSIPDIIVEPSVEFSNLEDL